MRRRFGILAGVWGVLLAGCDPSDPNPDPDGPPPLCAKRFGDGAEKVVRSLGVDVGGGPISDAGGGNMIVFKLNAGGAHVWSKRFGDAGSCPAGRVSADAAGNVLRVGYTAET